MDHITEIHTTEGSKQDSYSVLFVCVDCFVMLLSLSSSSSSSMYLMSFIDVFVIFDSVFFMHHRLVYYVWPCHSSHAYLHRFISYCHETESWKTSHGHHVVNLHSVEIVPEHIPYVSKICYCTSFLGPKIVKILLPHKLVCLSVCYYWLCNILLYICTSLRPISLCKIS